MLKTPLLLPDHASLFPSVGLYIHFPFCARKCHYCDFPSFAGQEDSMARYLQALHEEIDAAPRLAVRSIFLGGGTPSYIPGLWMGEVLAHLKAHFAWDADIEVTMESNPGNERLHDSDAQVEWEKYRAMGLNRISLGVQSFDAGLLETLGRIHSPEDAITAVGAVKAAGFSNLSIDLMYGLPDQSLAQWERSLKEAIALNLPHISAYSLIIEPHTPFETLSRQGRLALPDENQEQAMAEMAHTLLSEAGFHQYEISNWAKAGFESRHNKVYWQNEPWLGLGLGAHSYLNRRRWSNPATLNAYFSEGPTQPPQMPQALAMEIEETMFMGLRLTDEGVSDARFKRRFGAGLLEVYPAVIKRLEEQGLLEWEGDRLRLTKRGRPLANEAFAAFLAE